MTHECGWCRRTVARQKWPRKSHYYWVGMGPNLNSPPLEIAMHAKCVKAFGAMCALRGMTCYRSSRGFKHADKGPSTDAVMRNDMVQWAVRLGSR